MRLAREILTVFLILIAAYLVLVHFTGFSKDVAALGSFATSTTTALQGR